MPTIKTMQWTFTRPRAINLLSQRDHSPDYKIYRPDGLIMYLDINLRSRKKKIKQDSWTFYNPTTRYQCRYTD